MRRWLVLTVSLLLVGSMSAVAFADDEAPEGDESVESSGELADKQMQRAQSLADFFAPRLSGDVETVESGEPEEAADEDPAVDALTGEIVDLRIGDEVVGWGALYKLLLLAEYREQTLTDTVAGFEGDGWAFGQVLKEMREDDGWQSENDTPRNLGQFKKEQRAEQADLTPKAENKNKNNNKNNNKNKDD
jgi:hypothetical protein